MTPGTAIGWGAGNAQVAQAAGIDTSEGRATVPRVRTPERKPALGALSRARLARAIEATLQGAKARAGVPPGGAARADLPVPGRIG